MRRLALFAALACAAPLWLAAGAAAAAPSASSIEAEASRAEKELELLGRGSSPVGGSRNGAIAVLKLENADGYEISVIAFGQTVALGVSRADDHSALTVYLAHGRVTPTSIRASFAERGRIAVRLRPSGQGLPLSRHSGCNLAGHGAIGRAGVYVGELSFRGEGGYTSASAHRMKGMSIDLGALRACLGGASRNRLAAMPPGVPTHPSTGPKPTTLVADAKLPLARTAFAAEARGSHPVHFLAQEEQSEGALGVVRYAIAAAPRRAFAADAPLSLATVVPPPPFSGTATFQRGPGAAKSWSGSLAVSFLGAPDVPLTGAPFKAQLARGW